MAITSIPPVSTPAAISSAQIPAATENRQPSTAGSLRMKKRAPLHSRILKAIRQNRDSRGSTFNFRSLIINYKFRNQSNGLHKKFGGNFDKEAPSRVIHFQYTAPKKINDVAYLNGQVCKVRVKLKRSQHKLKSNLELAKSINGYVQKTISISPNYPHRLHPCDESDDSLLQKLKVIRTNNRTWLEAIEKARFLKRGNCHEMALIGLQYPKMGKVLAERFSIQGGDHTFIVLGRDPHTPPHLPMLWNNEAVIIDPWANAYYPAKFHLQFLMNFKETADLSIRQTIYQSNKKVPIVEPFDPIRHSLRKDPEYALSE